MNNENKAMEMMQKNSSNTFQSSTPAANAVEDSGQYLTLRLGSEEYAIDILRVQ